MTVGSSVLRIDARAKVTGEALYPGDINLPGQLWMKVLFARRPHAIVKNIDTQKAQAVAGVVAVLTAKDVPVNEYGLIQPDQPVLCGPGSSKPFADRVRFIGDQVALVIAKSEEIAEKACHLIEVDYEDLPVIGSMKEALAPGAPIIHPERDQNTFCHYRIRKGDVEAAFKKCDVIIEGVYETPVQEHAYLQPEAGIAYVDDEGRVTVKVAGQWTHEDQEQIAHALNLPLEKVRVIYPAIGGAFGGREDMSVQIILALAAHHLHQRGINAPVKIVWNREESIIGHHKRHAYQIKTRWGATNDGKVLAAEVDILEDGGAYMYTSTKVLGNATLMCTGPYDIENVKVDTRAVYTNNIPGGAFRGFGGPQGAFAAEMQMNKLAEALQMDAVELRMKNVINDSSLLSVGTKPPKGVTIDRVLEKCAERAGWNKTETGWQKPAHATPTGENNVRSGLGIACAYKNVGFSYGAPEKCTAAIELHGDRDIEKVVLRHAGAEVGQGVHTVLVQFASKALSIPMEKIQLIASDTLETGNSGSVSASRMTFMSGNSIKGAASAALEKWANKERPAIAEYTYFPPPTTPLDPQTGKCEPNFSYGYVAEAVQLAVNMDTGEVWLEKVFCADDVGKAVNPQQVQGQIEGCIVQAAGYVLLENFIQKNGLVLTNELSKYLIPTVLDIPFEVESLVLEYNDPIGPYGARGVGEMPYLPLAPAIMDAMKAATGIWFDEFPLTPEKVLRKLGKIK